MSNPLTAAQQCSDSTLPVQPRSDPFEHLTFLAQRSPRPQALHRQPRKRPHRGNSKASELDAEAAAFFRRLCSAWGLEASRYRSSIFRRRQAASLRALRSSSPADGELTLRSDRTAAERALGAVMIGVTSFFRDPVVFEALPALIEPFRRDGVSVRAISVGGSDGSELYSLAMLLAQQDLLSGASLIGLDCRPSAIAAAKAGVYSLAATENVPTDMRRRYLVAATAAELGSNLNRRVGPVVRVTDDLRACCQWHVTDAFASERKLGTADIILCRNLCIYLTSAAASELWSNLVSQLAPNGLLVVGKAERPPSTLRTRLHKIGPCTYRKILSVKDRLRS